MPVGNFSADTGAMSGDAAAYRKFAQGDSDSGRFYKTLMDTGGFTPDELTDIRTVGNRTVPSFFANLRNTLRTSQNATGGYNPGYSGQNAAMARDAAHQTQDAVLDTETGIADRVHQGKLQGAGGLERAFLGGMGGASNLDQAIAQAQAQAAGINLQGLGIQAGLMGNVAQGYGNLYGQDQSDLFNSEAAKQRALGMSNDQINQNLNQRAAYNPNQSGFDKYGMPILSGLAGIGGSFLGGGKKGGYNPASVNLTGDSLGGYKGFTVG